MNDVKYSYNSYTMNEPSIVLGTAILEDEEYFQETRNKIIDTREWLQIEMRQIGFRLKESKAKYMFEINETLHARFLKQRRKQRFMSVILISQESIII